MMAVDPRPRVKSVFRQDVACVQNSPTAVFFNCRANEALELQLGKLASLSREAITTQAAEEQLKAYTSLSAESVRATGMNVFFGDKDMAFHLVSNWLRADLFEKMDFSPAILKPAPADVLGGQRGHPTYYQAADSQSVDAPLRLSLLVVMGRDYDGNLWLSCVMPRQVWPKLLQFLDSFEREDLVDSEPAR